MDAETLVLSLLQTSPDREIRGKKRLQKLAYFATNLGARAAVQFSLHDFGPFSPDVASAAQMLSLFGEVTENQIQAGNTKCFVTVYKISDHTKVLESLPDDVAAKLASLDPYSTVELEIASTILYFYNLSHDWAASIAATQDLKPTKSVPQVIRRATEALSGVHLYEGRRADPVPGP